MANGWPVAKEFAERIGCDPAELSRWENGKVQPEFDTVVNFAKVLGVSVGEFMQNGEPEPNGDLEIDDDFNPWKRLAEKGTEDLRSEVVAELRAIRESGEPWGNQLLARDSVASLIGAAAMFAEALARDTAERAAIVRAEVVKLIEQNAQARRAPDRSGERPKGPRPRPGDEQDVA